MTVGDRAVDVRRDPGTDSFPRIPGTRSLPPKEAVAVREDVRPATVCHEPSAPGMAWGYAEVNGRPRGAKAGPLE